jgi:hypothetical protein
MPPPFLHQRRTELHRLLQSGDEALRACTARAPDLIAVVFAHVGDAGASYEGLSMPDATNHMLGLAAQAAEARDGIDPFTRERVAVRRREMQRTVSLVVLLDSGQRLRADWAEADRLIEELRERLVPLALFAVQRSMVSRHVGRDLTQAELEVVWKALCNDPESQPVARQVSTSAGPADIVLVLGELLESIP